MQPWENKEDEIGRTIGEMDSNKRIPIIIHEKYVNTIKNGDIVVMERSGKDETIACEVSLLGSPQFPDSMVKIKGLNSDKIFNGKIASIKILKSKKVNPNNPTGPDLSFDADNVPAWEPVRGYGIDKFRML